MTKRKPRTDAPPRPLRKAQPPRDAATASEPTTARRPCRSSTELPEIRGVLPVPKGIMPWERELLLPIVLESLPDFVESKDHAEPNLDKKAK